MKIAVIGSGNVGGTLGKRWAILGHDVIFGTRDPSAEKIQALLAEAGANAKAAIQPEAAQEAEVIVLATPWSATQEILGTLGNLKGKVLIDCTNPIGPGFQLTVGHTSSGGEQVAHWAKGAKVVKAFNSTGAENMADPIYDGEETAMIICGDDEAAKATTTQLAQALGFEVTDAGGLTMARYLEPFAMVWINLAIVRGMGRDIAFKIVKR